MEVIQREEAGMLEVIGRALTLPIYRRVARDSVFVTQCPSMPTRAYMPE